MANQVAQICQVVFVPCQEHSLAWEREGGKEGRSGELVFGLSGLLRLVYIKKCLQGLAVLTEVG